MVNDTINPFIRHNGLSLCHN